MDRGPALRPRRSHGARLLSPLRELFLLDPEVTYLNHASFGAAPRPVFEEYQRRQRELERQPTEFLGYRVYELLDEARRRLAVYVGADADDLVFVPNATFALNLVARSLRLEPGDEVLATDHEYGAVDLLWEFICRRADARYVRRHVPLGLDTAEIADAVWARVTERTRVLFLSHVTSVTCLVFPIEELCRRAREAGIYTIVDGAHAVGQVPLDVASLGCDAYAGNCHKWLCAPKGAGFLYVRSEHQDAVESLVVGWGWAGGEHSFVTRNVDQGTRDPSAYLAVPAALEFAREHDWAAVTARCRELARDAAEALAAALGAQPLAPQPLQMVATPLPACDPRALMRRLVDEHRVQVYGREWNGLPFLRTSFQGYNDERDVERLLDVLPRALAAQALGTR